MWLSAPLGHSQSSPGGVQGGWSGSDLVKHGRLYVFDRTTTSRRRITALGQAGLGVHTWCSPLELGPWLAPGLAAALGQDWSNRVKL
jgi:hypothetical protein